eukprot:CAMPEP_0168357690 /NCGR_PEP_ID=MMETSP0228-20121227/722_1 /TAXON_ID=133427 /ORGANISM="Protoceratium reticulatum, Strain CCCM 535 (=CCMP 1889)" /LENGTH=30 /DNA_ID= /DNA_START= /DNA_END= /DNA_ORIENTATION=
MSPRGSCKAPRWMVSRRSALGALSPALLMA